METQKTAIQAKPVNLSYDDQEEIITFVKDTWDKGKAERKYWIDQAKQCEDAYHCRREPILSPELSWMSNICLPWAYDASDSWYAHIHQTTIPKNDQIFTISGRTDEDHPGADMMQKYLEYRFDRNHYARQLGRAYKDLSIKNHTCLKVYWREDITVEYNWVDEPVMGLVPHPETSELVPGQVGTNKVRKPQERQLFNNVWVDVVDLDNFVMHPIRGDFEKTTKIHETYKYYEDLKASAETGESNYFNLDEITLDDEKENSNPVRYEEKTGDKRHPAGLNIKEAWIHRVKIGDKVYRNYIATIVNGKTLIRFQPFPPGCPKSPFVFMALRPDGDCFYGFGLNSKGLGILETVNKKYNGWVDEGQLTQHQAHKYYNDGVFNPNNVIRRPGAMVELTQQGVQDNLIPLIDNLAPQQQIMQDLAALKIEFEQVTVPKVVKGMIDTGNDHTATEISQAQNNSNGKMHIDAYNINDFLIKPVIELTYQAIYDRMQFDESITQEIQTVTQPKDQNGNPMRELPALPLPEVDIKVVGYQNVIRKQEQLAAAGQVIGTLAQTPAAQYIKWYGVLEQGVELSDLDKDRIIMNDDERKAADQQNQQQQQGQQQADQQAQQLMVQQGMAQLTLQKEKQDQDYHIKQIELELKRIEIEGKYMMGQAEVDLKTNAQDFGNVLGLHQAEQTQQQADQQAQLNERKQAHAEQTSAQSAGLAQQQQDHQQVIDQKTVLQKPKQGDTKK